MIDLLAAAQLVRAGRLSELIGLRENIWLDAKSEPYRVSTPAQKWELAKDVAAFGNAKGGLLVFPVRTERGTNEEALERVVPCDLSLIDVKTYKNVIGAWVYPTPHEVDVDVVETEPGRGYGFIFVPPQDERRRPFLVTGTEADPKQNRSHSLTIPWRDGDGTRYEDIGAIHAALNRWQRDDYNEQRLLEATRMDALNAFDQAVVHDAREAGMTVDVAHGHYWIHIPEGDSLRVDTSNTPTVVGDLHFEQILKRLSEHGLKTVRLSSGKLVPASWAARIPIAQSDGGSNQPT